MADGAAVRAALTGGQWRCERVLRTVTDVSVCTVREPGGRTGVLKVATAPGAIAGLRRERAVLERLSADARLGAWRTLLPVPLDGGDAGPGAFLLTSRLPGTDAAMLPVAGGRLTAAAFGAMSPLHRLDRTARRVDDSLLERWVNLPAERIRRALPSCDSVQRLTEVLRGELAGRSLTLGWAHGDLHPGNLLVSAAGQVTGIVDWGEASERDLPVLDLAFWLLAADAAGQQREFGERVAARLSHGRVWTPAETRRLDGATDGLADGRTVLLLAWLRHVASNLANTNCAENVPWLRRNIVAVLREVSRG